MPSKDSHKVLIVAAEPSSCLYAQRLLEHWKREGLSVEAFGIGDKAMAQVGFECIGHAEELAVMGFVEVLGHWKVIKTAFYKLLDAAKTRKPDFVLLLDYPGFNLRFAKKAKALGLPVVYYLSPQVWAWKQGRVKTIREIVDKMLVAFPFEVDFYKKHDVTVEFVGHPLLDELDPKHFDPEARSRHRAKYGVTDADLVLALMPGSRTTELKYHLAPQLEAARTLVQRHPQLKVMLFVAPNFSKEEIQAQLAGLDFPLILIKDEPFTMIDLADVVLCASGTATLMVGLLEKPMVIMYKVNPITAFIAGFFVQHTKHFGLINLVLDQAVAPELFQKGADAPHLVKQIDPLLVSATERRDMAAKLKDAKNRLGNPGATKRVAEVLKEYWS